jgi:DNA-binding transcriptional LysR family regulator
MAELDHYMRVNLKPKHLQLVVALDDFRNIGQVAANANVTQPAVSKALAELERGLGVRLFERTARGVRPTIYGECLVRHARSVIANLTQTRDELRALISARPARSPSACSQRQQSRSSPRLSRCLNSVHREPQFSSAKARSKR